MSAGHSFAFPSHVEPNVCSASQPSQSEGSALDLPLVGIPNWITQYTFTTEASVGMSKAIPADAGRSQPTTTKQLKQAGVVPKLPVITIVPDANPTYPVGSRGPNAAAAALRQRQENSTWNASFCDCCCSVAPTYCCIITCCPCTTIASVKETLGGGYERTLLYFGGLAFGVLFCIGFAASNNSGDYEQEVGDKTSSPPPPHHAGIDSSVMWEAAAFTFLMAFLFSVWRLRMQTRRSLGIQGSRVNDCLSSFFCCFCVISQLHLELKCQYEEPPVIRTAQYGRGQRNDHLAVDTLAPYAVM
ncbi:unnamed protein product [Phytophthora lilii]|uniref:Unnamed protein product n=1 Tax=Phytophthora lilii TaxID=2077276 RepID=A0A9W6TWG3_9STRA|nr:unnamed protein product [Phytophthora lilii]